MKISENELQIGDLVFYSQPFWHVRIYVGIEKTPWQEKKMMKHVSTTWNRVAKTIVYDKPAGPIGYGTFLK